MHYALVTRKQDARAYRLRTARIRAGYKSAAAAARAMGIEPSTYAGHENGFRGFPNEAQRYASFFKVRLEWLLEGAGAEKGNPLEQVWARLPEEAQGEVIRFLDYIETRYRKS